MEDSSHGEKYLLSVCYGFQSSGAADGVVTMGELRAFMQTAMPDETQKVLGAAKHPVITTSSGAPDIWQLPVAAKP